LAPFFNLYSTFMAGQAVAKKLVCVPNSISDFHFAGEDPRKLADGTNTMLACAEGKAGVDASITYKHLYIALGDSYECVLCGHGGKIKPFTNFLRHIINNHLGHLAPSDYLRIRKAPAAAPPVPALFGAPAGAAAAAAAGAGAGGAGAVHVHA
jgi:hypothetical protein